MTDYNQNLIYKKLNFKNELKNK